MPRGQPDYGEYAVKEVSASVSDMGEVAARLGSIVTFDKRGDVVDFDNFEEPVLRWCTIVSEAGNYVRFSNDSASSGSQSVRLHVEGAALGRAGMHSGIPLLGSLRLGMEISFAVPTLGGYLALEVSYFTGSKLCDAILKFYFSTLKLYLINDTGSDEEVASLERFINSAYVYHTLKLVGDFNTGKYVRLLLDNLTYDISHIAMYSQTDLTSPCLERNVNYYPFNSVGGDVYLDDFVFTQAEP